MLSTSFAQVAYNLQDEVLPTSRRMPCATIASLWCSGGVLRYWWQAPAAHACNIRRDICEMVEPHLAHPDVNVKSHINTEKIFQYVLIYFLVRLYLKKNRTPIEIV